MSDIKLYGFIILKSRGVGESPPEARHRWASLADFSKVLCLNVFDDDRGRFAAPNTDRGTSVAKAFRF